MGIIVWAPKQKKTKQLNTITPANVGIGNTFSVVINSKTYTFTATAATVANVTAGLYALLSASTEPEFTEVTWADGTTAVTGTAVTGGKPFTQTSSATGGTATLVTVVTTANQSPEDVNDATNYSTAALPGAGDDMYVDDTDDFPGKWNLGSLSAVTLTSLNWLNSFEADWGLPAYDTDGTVYLDYRPVYFVIGAATVNVGDGLGNGSGRLKLNGGSVQSTINVFRTGSSSETDKEAFLWKGSHASNAMNVFSGSVGVAVFGGETATLLTLRVAGGSVRLGSGVTLTTVEQSGGTLDTSSAITTKTHRGGTHVHRVGAIGTLTITDGSVDVRANGTVTTLTIGPGTVDFSNDPRAITITNCTIYPGGTLIDKKGRITFTNPISVPGGLDSVTIIRGGSTNLQFS